MTLPIDACMRAATIQPKLTSCMPACVVSCSCSSSLKYDGNTVQLLTYQKLKRMSADEVRAASAALQGVIAGRLPAPPEGAPDEDVIIWILQVEVALAHGQDLRNTFGSPVDAVALGVPAEYIEGHEPTQPPTPQPSGAA